MITIPLYLGHMKNGKNVWHVLLDVDDANVAAGCYLQRSHRRIRSGCEYHHFPNGNVDYSKVHDQGVAIDTVNTTATLT